MNACPHGDDPHLCPPCQQPPEGRQARGITYATIDGKPFPAKYAGHCRACDQTIDVGERMVGTLEYGWVHHRCVEDDPWT